MKKQKSEVKMIPGQEYAWQIYCLILVKLGKPIPEPSSIKWKKPNQFGQLVDAEKSNE